MADEKKPEASIEARNADLKERVTLSLNKWNDGVLRNIEAAEKQETNQGISPAVFAKMKEARNKNLPALIEESFEIAKFRNIDGNVTQLSHVYIGEKTGEALKAFEGKVANDVKAGGINGLAGEELDRQVNAASSAVTRELPKPGILNTITSAFFDPDKDGFRWGGIAGGILGLIAGVFMGGGVEGGLLGIAVMIMGVIAGTLAGNFASDAFAAKKEPEARGQERAREKSQSPAPRKELEKDTDHPDKKEEKKQGEGKGDSLEPKEKQLTPPSDSELRQNERDGKTSSTETQVKYFPGDDSLSGYIAQEKAKKQADQLISPNGVILTPPDAGAIPTNAIGDVAKASFTRER